MFSHDQISFVRLARDAVTEIAEVRVRVIVENSSQFKDVFIILIFQMRKKIT